MYNVEDGHDPQHENPVKDVKKNLVALNEPIVTVEILDNAENRSDKDKDTSGI